MKIIFQISTMMHETWIGTKICQTITMKKRGVLQLALQLNF